MKNEIALWKSMSLGKISWVRMSCLGRNWHGEAKPDAWKSVWKPVKRGRAHVNPRFKQRNCCFPGPCAPELSRGPKSLGCQVTCYI